MRRKRKSLTPETPLAPVPEEILDQFVRQGPISNEELDAAVRAPSASRCPGIARAPSSRG